MLKGLLIFAVSFVLVGCSGHFESASTSEPPSYAVLQGSWQNSNGCYGPISHPLYDSFSSTWNFSGHELTETNTYFTDAVCATPALIHKRKFDFTLARSPLNAEATNFTGTLVHASLQPMNVDIADELNSYSGCATDWVATVEKDLTHLQPCQLFAGSGFHDTDVLGLTMMATMYVYPTEIYFADPETAQTNEFHLASYRRQLPSKH
ncbi:MAG: hypothetical protein EOP06_08185 [Proteobacteria bacterium]|nr:MAG: hypothetical protein EOP06_08185 [Pseudomonadota bacterium]